MCKPFARNRTESAQLDLRSGDELPPECQPQTLQMYLDMVGAMYLDGTGRIEFSAYFNSNEVIDYVNTTVTSTVQS